MPLQLRCVLSGENKDCSYEYTRTQTYNTFHYPCDPSTRAFYARNAPCIRNLIKQMGPVRACAAFAALRLLDGSNDVSTGHTCTQTCAQVCETYNLLLDCMYDHVVNACGVEPMEMLFQILERDVHQLTVASANCALRRPVQPAKLTPNKSSAIRIDNAT